MNISSLPKELIHEILSNNLSRKDVWNLCNTNLQFRTICKNQAFWRQLIYTEYPNLYEYDFPEDVSWRDLYFNYYYLDREIVEPDLISRFRDKLQERSYLKRNNELKAYMLKDYHNDETKTKYITVHLAHSFEEAVLKIYKNNLDDFLYTVYNYSDKPIFLNIEETLDTIIENNIHHER